MLQKGSARPCKWRQLGPESDDQQDLEGGYPGRRMTRSNKSSGGVGTIQCTSSNTISTGRRVASPSSWPGGPERLLPCASRGGEGREGGGHACWHGQVRGSEERPRQGPRLASVSVALSHSNVAGLHRHAGSRQALEAVGAAVGKKCTVLVMWRAETAQANMWIIAQPSTAVSASAIC